MSDKKKRRSTIKRLSPHEATTLSKTLLLNRDNFSTRHGWILSDGTDISIAQQVTGEEAKGIARLPKKEFKRMVDWYLKQQTVGKSDASV